MKNKNKKTTRTQKPVVVNSDGTLLSVPPKQSYSPLRVYSEEELALLSKSDPSFWANDTANYSDKIYVRNMCELYVDIIEYSTEKLTKVQHFKIAELELALEKLSNEHPTEYQNICRIYGIAPKTQKSRTRLTKSCFADIVYIFGWGYIELFYPNIHVTANKLARKMHSCSEMSDLEKAKYAHAFFLFIYTFNLMPYDFNEYLAQLEKQKKLSKVAKQALFQENLEKSHKAEKGHVYEAIMLSNAYDALFQTLPDDSINLDMIRYFFDQIIDEKDALLIKEFLDLLTEEESKKFKSQNLKPLMYNTDIRALKERIFPVGGWDTDIKLFVHARDKKFEKSIAKAWSKYSENSYVFGKNVEGYKRPPVFTQVSSGEKYTYVGYMYASSPMRIRVSDPNELEMMLAHMMYYKHPENC